VTVATDRTISDDGLSIAWHEWDGTGVPVVLQHGFVSSTRGNWVDTGVVDALVGAGHHVVGIDARGHGGSDHPHDARYYGEAAMAHDVRSVVDDLGVAAYDLVGYSMGAIIALLVAAEDHRVRRLVVGGVGAGVVELGGLDTRAVGSTDALVHALTTDDPSSLDRSVIGFRKMADANGSDRLALAAHASVRHATPIDLAAIRADALVLAGADDPLAVRPEELAATIGHTGGARLELVRGDHMGALRDPRFTAAVVEHLAG
jgi:pimeloyl-ACP methyl ester carboxylesterase